MPSTRWASPSSTSAASRPQRIRPAPPRSLKAATGYDMAICDINDINPAWCVASTLSKERKRLLERSFDDNPLGQTDEQTPIGIWREVG